MCSFHAAVQPPSIRNELPVTESVPGPQRKATMSATSAGSTSRFTGVRARSTPSRTSSSAIPWRAGLVGDLPLDQGGTDVAGADGVAGDAATGRLQGDHLGEALEAVLGRHVGRLVRRRAVAVHRGDVHEPAEATLVHAREQRPGQPERRLEHQPLDEPEPLGVEVLHRRHVLHAGVVDQDVGLHGGAQAELLDRRTVGEVGDQVVAAELGGDLLGAGLVAVEHDDPRAVRGEPRGDGPADAAGAAGDEGGPAVEGSGATRGRDGRLSHAGDVTGVTSDRTCVAPT